MDLNKKFDDYITPNNLLGQGMFAKVYAIDDDFVIRLIGTESINNQKFNIVNNDYFEGKNFGQPVAISENKNITINKRVHGVPLYPGINHLKPENISKESYLNLLKKYSDLSDNVYEQFMVDALFLFSKGYIIDYKSAKNFLYDEEKQLINIIDYKENINSESLNNLYFTSPLCYGNIVFNIYFVMSEDERKIMFDYIRYINNRIIKLCNKHNIQENSGLILQRCHQFDFSNILLLIDKIDCKNSALDNQIMDLIGLV